jgi:hypothetical protein
MLDIEPNCPSKSQITGVLGKKWDHGVRGSTTYFVMNFHGKGGHKILDWMEGAKGIFESFEKGLLLRIFKSNKFSSIPIPHDQVLRMAIYKGVEAVSPVFLTPFWLLLKLGVRVEIARYFILYPREYSILPTKLSVVTKDFEMQLESNGFSFLSQKEYFSEISKRFNFEFEIHE